MFPVRPNEVNITYPFHASQQGQCMVVRPRLNKSILLRKGLDTLAEDGPDSLTAARVSQELSVTRGSFYWHFKSVPEFHQQLREFWRDEIVLGVPNDAKARFKDPRQILKAIGELAKQRKNYRFDTAMRNWAALQVPPPRLYTNVVHGYGLSHVK